MMKSPNLSLDTTGIYSLYDIKSVTKVSNVALGPFVRILVIENIWYHYQVLKIMESIYLHRFSCLIMLTLEYSLHWLRDTNKEDINQFKSLKAWYFISKVVCNQCQLHFTETTRKHDEKATDEEAPI